MMEEERKEKYLVALKKSVKSFNRWKSILTVKAIARARLRGMRIAKVKAKTFWGDEMIVVLPECVSAGIYDAGFFEEGLTNMVINHLNRGMVFIDIGTHFGYFSLLASRLVGKNGQVHAFEPTPSTFNILKHNLSGRSNVHLNNIALWSNEQKLSFNDYGLRYSAFNSVYEARLDKKTRGRLKPREYTINAVSVDNYVFSRGLSPDFIKIDAESAEHEIIKGMRKTIYKFHPVISIEVGDAGVSGVIDCKSIVLDLISKGYDVFEFSRGRIIKHRIRNNYEYNNLFFIPKIRRSHEGD